MVIGNPRSGAHLTPHALGLWSGRWRRDLARANLAAATLTDWADGPPAVRLTTRAGAAFRVPGPCIGDPRAFVAVLADCGIPVTRD